MQIQQLLHRELKFEHFPLQSLFPGLVPGLQLSYRLAVLGTLIVKPSLRPLVQRTESARLFAQPDHLVVRCRVHAVISHGSNRVFSSSKRKKWHPNSVQPT